MTNVSVYMAAKWHRADGQMRYPGVLHRDQWYTYREFDAAEIFLVEPGMVSLVLWVGGCVDCPTGMASDRSKPLLAKVLEVIFFLRMGKGIYLSRRLGYRTTSL